MNHKNNALTNLIPFFLFFFFASSQLMGKSFSVGLLGGFGFPQTPKSFKNSYSTGLGLGGELKFDMSKRTAVRLTARCQNQDIKTSEDIIIHALVESPESMGAAFRVRGGELTLSSISTSIIYNIVRPKRFPKVYLTLGGSFHFIKTTDLNLDATFQGQTMAMISYYSADQAMAYLGIHEGLGLEKNIHKCISFFTEIQYEYLFTNSPTHEFIWDDDYDEDLKLSYLTLLAGIRLTIQ